MSKGKKTNKKEFQKEGKILLNRDSYSASIAFNWSAVSTRSASEEISTKDKYKKNIQQAWDTGHMAMGPTHTHQLYPIPTVRTP